MTRDNFKRTELTLREGLAVNWFVKMGDINSPTASSSSARSRALELIAMHVQSTPHEQEQVVGVIRVIDSLLGEEAVCCTDDLEEQVKETNMTAFDTNTYESAIGHITVHSQKPCVLRASKYVQIHSEMQQQRRDAAVLKKLTRPHGPPPGISHMYV
jgi:hypothetical protein